MVALTTIALEELWLLLGEYSEAAGGTEYFTFSARLGDPLTT